LVINFNINDVYMKQSVAERFGVFLGSLGRGESFNELSMTLS